MGDFSGWTRRLAIGAVLAALLTALTATGINAATPPITFDVGIGDGCFFGTAKPNSYMRIAVRNARGVLQGRANTEVYDDGYWEFCDFYGVIRPGYEISARNFNENGTLRTSAMVVRDLSIRVDRITDVVSGRGPAHGTVLVTLSEWQFEPWGGDYSVQQAMPVNASGRWQHDFGSDGINIRGGAVGTVEWWNSSRTVHITRYGAADQLWVWRDTPEFGGNVRMNGNIQVTLGDASGVVAVGHGQGDYYTGSFWGLLADDRDELYDLQGGESLSAPDVGGGVAWTVPSGITSIAAATDVVSGKCFPNGRFLVSTSSDSDYGFKVGRAAGDGSFSRDMSSQMNLRPGDDVTVICYTGAGDYFGDDAKVR
jgi:hypothetical protein